MRRYNEKYDSFYDDEKDIWLEDCCDERDCTYCPDRPDKPSACKTSKEKSK